MPSRLSTSTASRIWVVVRPKMLRSPPLSVHMPSALEASFTRTPMRGETPRARERSMIWWTSPGRSMTMMTCSPSLTPRRARSVNSSSL